MQHNPVVVGVVSGAWNPKIVLLVKVIFTAEGCSLWTGAKHMFTALCCAGVGAVGFDGAKAIPGEVQDRASDWRDFGRM